MDTLTHALSGALLARATGCTGNRHGLSLKERTLAGFVAAGFPDLDYALFWLAPLGFLNWHRGPTHSLLLLPLWAWLLAMIMARFSGSGRYPWQAFYGVCILGISVHLLGDIITFYGTKLLSPLTDADFGLGIVFDVDPYIALIIAAGFAGSLIGRPVQAAGVTLVVLTAYLLLQTLLYWQTVAVGRDYVERQGLEGAEVYAMPQPFAPSMWKIIVAQEERYRVARLNYLAREALTVTEAAWLPRRVLAAYRPIHDLHWEQYHRFGGTEEKQALAGEAWQEERFAAFRRFAVLPALYRIDRQNEEVCVWFTDLRHILPALHPPFRYGLCRTDPADWRLYRLRYFTVDDRQSL